jgi:hypothetical protein
VVLCSFVAAAFVCSALCAGVAVRAGALGWLGEVLAPAAFAPLAFAAPLPVAPLYGAAALAGTTPAPLKFPGFAVAATAGFPWFTEANWLRSEAAACRCSVCAVVGCVCCSCA